MAQWIKFVLFSGFDPACLLRFLYDCGRPRSAASRIAVIRSSYDDITDRTRTRGEKGEEKAYTSDYEQSSCMHASTSSNGRGFEKCDMATLNMPPSLCPVPEKRQGGEKKRTLQISSTLSRWEQYEHPELNPEIWLNWMK